tara:strand:+ start:409 stop:648 length:240 start_codon:yes stop_codon:yes gene_type:complete
MGRDVDRARVRRVAAVGRLKIYVAFVKVFVPHGLPSVLQLHLHLHVMLLRLRFARDPFVAVVGIQRVEYLILAELLVVL